jgi:GNAT superfamily N-acetyltransferase
MDTFEEKKEIRTETKVQSKEIERKIEETADFSEIKRLYRSAFPKEEQIPFGLLRFLTVIRGVELIGYREEQQFCGFTYTVTEGNIVFVLFFAVNSGIRGQGYGSSILKYLKNKHPSRQIVLNVEPLDAQAENTDERVRRMRFYEKNGFYDIGYEIDEIGGTFRVLATEKTIDLHAYLRIFKKMSFGFWKPRIVRATNVNEKTE